MSNRYTKKGRAAAARERNFVTRIKAGAHTADETTTFACNTAGMCCRLEVLIFPPDVYRLVTTPETVAVTGYRTSVDYVGGPAPAISYYLGPDSGLPVASLRKDPDAFVPGMDVCTFARPQRQIIPLSQLTRARLTVDGQPMRLCGVHAGRPSTCRVFPYTKMAAMRETETVPTTPEGAAALIDWMGESKFSDAHSECRDCYPTGYDQGPKRTLRQFFDDSGATETMRQSALWMQLLTEKVIHLAPTERQIIGSIAYDFDRARVTAGQSAEQIARERPQTYEELHAILVRLADALLAGNPIAFFEGIFRLGGPSVADQMARRLEAALKAEPDALQGESHGPDAAPR